MKNLLVIYVVIGLNVKLSKATNSIALGKQSRQSTTYNESTFIFVPELAVNGEFGDWDSAFKCAHTEASFNPWWAVDLGEVFTVSNILIYGRTDCCQTHLANFDVDVITQPECSCDKWATFQRGRAINCHYQLGSTKFLNITCPDNTNGRFIRIRRRDQFYLVLCEVEVFGQLFPKTTVPTNSINACGFNDQSYDGTFILKTTARSNVECVMFCVLTDQCCAAEFSPITSECTLDSKFDNLEETTHSFVEDPSKITFML